jgi:hypothetical protein
MQEAALAIVIPNVAEAVVEQRGEAFLDVRPGAAEAAIALTPLGERGPPGELVFHEHVQSSPSATWTINHNLGFLPPIALRTLGGVVFDAQITHVSNNQAIVSLATPVAGFARCN